MGLFKKMFNSLSTKDVTVESGTSSGEVPEEAREIVDQLEQQFPDAQVQVQTVDVSGDPEAAKGVISAVEAATGQDLDGDGKVSGRNTAATPAGGGDRISQLERLAKLHEQGVLDDAELAAEKAKILGS